MNKKVKKPAVLPSLFLQPEFLLGANDVHQFPNDQVIEVAFAGRSNVGKSSAINVITNRNKLARTSKTPGRTQQINFFTLNDNVRLVDLPGYGFAQVPLKIKAHWQKTIQTYLADRENLLILVLLMDIRHPLTELDKQMARWASDSELPVHVLLTKADKFKRGKTNATVLKVRKELASYGDTFTVQAFSSLDYEGVEYARQYIANYCESALKSTT